MEWEKLDWSALDRLRDGFLSGSAANGPYWRSLTDLEHYNLTFGERIGWKWDAVLRELRLRKWNPALRLTGTGSPAKLTMLDWGCGSGIAGRRVLESFGPEHFQTLWLWDHSPAAREYAATAARKTFPDLTAAEWPSGEVPDVLVVSHVVNELSPAVLAGLLEFARRSACVLWVEPGTHTVSRKLIGIREQLRAETRIVAPCTHQAACGLLTPANAPHWCHYFADPPGGIYADSDWVKFGQRAGIDLRSLPYCFLVTERADLPGLDSADYAGGAARILGEARHYKGFAKVLSCEVDGVSELTLQKRDDPALFKALKRPEGIPIYRWTRETGRIKDATQSYPAAPV